MKESVVNFLFKSNLATSILSILTSRAGFLEPYCESPPQIAVDESDDRSKALTSSTGAAKIAAASSTRCSRLPEGAEDCLGPSNVADA